MALWVMTRNRERDGFVSVEADGLAGARVHGVDLRQAYLNHTDLRGAHLTRIDLRGAFLLGARLDEVVLRDASLVGTRLEGASLRGSHISEVGAHFVRLDRADLRGCTFEGSLEHAELPHAWLQGADLSAAELRHTNLTGVCYDAATRWPEGQVPPASACPLVALQPPRLSEKESLAVLATLLERAERFAGRNEVREDDRFVVPLPGIAPVPLEGLRLMASSGPRA